MFSKPYSNLLFNADCPRIPVADKADNNEAAFVDPSNANRLITGWMCRIFLINVAWCFSIWRTNRLSTLRRLQTSFALCDLYNEQLFAIRRGIAYFASARLVDRPFRYFDKTFCVWLWGTGRRFSDNRLISRFFVLIFVLSLSKRLSNVVLETLYEVVEARFTVAAEIIASIPVIAVTLGGDDDTNCLAYCLNQLPWLSTILYQLSTI